MTTRALDLVTILHALSKLNDHLQVTCWNAKNVYQEQVFAWLQQYREDLAKLTGIDALASSDWEELNLFLTERGFSPMVTPFDPADGLGVVSVLDKLVKWLNGPGEKVEIPTQTGAKPGFELPDSGVKVHRVSGYEKSYLLEILTTSQDTLWLFVHDVHTLEGIDLIRLSIDVMNKPRAPYRRESLLGRGEYAPFAGAQIPMLDFDVMPDLSWMEGADTTDPGEYFYIAQAKQQFKLRMDHTGARVKVATVFVAMRGISEDPKPFVINGPFYGWWTQAGVPFPMAAFYADWDAMKEPAGSLEDL